MDIDEVGLNGAMLEMDFDYLSGGGKGAEGVNAKGFVVLDVGTCRVPMYNEKGEVYYPKAITVQDQSGNVFVHFKGTGDGFWAENDAAAGGGPSQVQIWALEYFNRTIQNNYEGKSLGNLYVTGHSQGGNNAQYVTIRSPYADYITNCVSLDGPGFSNQFIADSKNNLYGEAFYERQRNKIYGIYGEHDYASAYAQNDIIDPLHIRFVKQSTQRQVENPQDNPLYWFHAVEYMVQKDENGNWVWNGKSESSGFRELIKGVSRQIYARYDDVESRRIINILLGGVAEKYLGDKYLGNLTNEEFGYLVAKTLPVLVATIEKNPKLLSSALEALGVKPVMAESISNLVDHFNSYPEWVRNEALQAIAKGLKYENGKFGFDWTKMDIPAALVTTLPVLMETILLHPDDVLKIIHETGLDKALLKWIKENPWKFIAISVVAGIGIVVFSPVIIAIAKLVLVIGVIADLVIRLVQAVTWLAAKIKDAIVTAFNAIKNAIGKIAEFMRSLSAGVRYVASNPYFRADTEKLRAYATRIINVNNRLRNLDRDLRQCFLQVSVFQMARFAWINMLTSGSPTLNQVKAYMLSAADRIETTENKARGYVGG